MNPSNFNAAPVMGSAAPEMPATGWEQMAAPTSVENNVTELNAPGATPSLEQAAASMMNELPQMETAHVAEGITMTAEQPAEVERTANDIYSDIVDDLHALQKALEKQPDNEKLQTYVALNRAIADMMMEQASMGGAVSGETLSGLGAAANNVVTVNGGDIASAAFAQSGPEPAVTNPGVVAPGAARFDQNGMLLMDNEQATPTTWQGGEQNF